MIAIESITTLSKLLREMKRGWIKDLAKAMAEDGEEEKNTVTRIYNICYGQVTNQEARSKFMVEGYRLLKQYQGNKEEALAVVEALKNEAA